MAAEDWKRDLSEIVFARLPIIGWVTLAITVGAVAIALWYPPTYLANGSLLLRSKTAQVSTDSLNAPDVGIAPLTTYDLVSERQLLTSGTLIQRTISKLQEQGLIENPAYALCGEPHGWFSKLTQKMSEGLKRLASLGSDVDGEEDVDPEVIAVVTGIRESALEATIVPESTIITLSLKGRNRHRVERFLDTLISEYLNYRLEVLHPPDQRLFYRERRDFYSQRLKKLESQLVQATEAASLTDLESEISNNIDYVTALTQQQSDRRNQYMEQQQHTTMLKQALANDDVMYFAFLDNTILEALSEQLMALTIERGQMMRQFRDGSPQIVALDESVAAIAAELKAEVMGIYKDAVQKKNTLHAQIELLGIVASETKDRTRSLQNEVVRFQQLSREAELMRLSYESFARRNEEAEISEAVVASDVSGDVTVLSRPIFSAIKIFPKLLLTPILGLLIGLITGCSAAFVLEFFDHTIRRAADVTQFTSLPVIGSIRRVESFRFQNRKFDKKQNTVASDGSGKRHAS